MPERGCISNIARRTPGAASYVAQRRREDGQGFKTVMARNLRTMRNKPAVLRRKKVPLQLQQLASASIVASPLFLVLKRTMTGSPPEPIGDNAGCARRDEDQIDYGKPLL
jgi:hypothetical protein